MDDNFDEFDDEEYENAEIELKPGDSLFLYTDGLNEAVSAEHKFFGTERLEKELTSLMISGSGFSGMAWTELT